MRIKRLLVMLVMGITLVMVMYISADSMGERTKKESLSMMREGVKRAAVECYALEGFYPPNISYLTQRYGVSIDSSRYYVDYQYIGSNLMPDITVLPIGNSR